MHKFGTIVGYFTRILKIIGGIIASILVLLLAGLLILQLPYFQTRMTDFALGLLSEYTEGDITLDKIQIKPFNAVVLKNLTVTDKNPYRSPETPEEAPADTLLYANYLIAEFSLKGLFGQEGFHIDKVELINTDFNLVSENDGQMNLTRIFSILFPKEKKAPQEKEIFKINDVKINNLHFTMKSHRSADARPFSGGINWNDLDVEHVQVKASNLRMAGGIMTGRLRHLSGYEKSGYTIRNLSGEARVGKGKAIVTDISLQDPWSTVSINNFTMEYDSVADFKDYIHKVKMYADVRDADLDFETITYFAPQLKGTDIHWRIKGTAEGTVDKISTKGIYIEDLDGAFSGLVSGKMDGLPDIGKTRLDVTAENFIMTSAGLEHFINGWSRNGGLSLAGFAPKEIFRVNGKATGLLNNFNTTLKIRSTAGNVSADAKVTNVTQPWRGIGIQGKVSTHELDLGEFAGTAMLGPASLEADIEATVGGHDGTSAKLNSLKIDKLNANGYDYSNIAAIGTLSSTEFNGKIISHDPALNFLFQGTFAFSTKTNNALYKFYANVGMADLYAMNIDKRGKSKIQFQTVANFKKTNEGDILGNISISDLNVDNGKHRHTIGDIDLNSRSNGSTFNIDMKAPFATAKYTGSASVIKFIHDLQAVTAGQVLPALYKKSPVLKQGDNYRLDLNLSNTMDILSYVMPGMYIADSTSLSATVDTAGIFDFRMKSPRLAYNEHYIKNASFTANNYNSKLTGKLTSGEIRAATVTLDDNEIKLYAEDNHFGVGYTYNNKGDLTNRGEIYAMGSLSRTETGSLGIEVNIVPSTVYLNSKEWNIMPAKISYVDNIFKADGLEFKNGEQRIWLNGGVSKSKTDTLALNLERFDISVINPLVNMDLGVSGTATGSAKIISPFEKAGILADIVCDSTTLSNELLGTLDIKCRWNENFRRFDFNAENLLDGKKNIAITGNLHPKTRRLNATVNLEKLKIAYASVFLKDIFSDIKGSVSGQLHANGPINRLEIKSAGTRIDDGYLKIDFTNVGYNLAGTFDMDEYGVYFNDIIFKDRYGANGVLGGKMSYDHFWNLGFDLNVKANQLEAINLKEHQNEFFYGQLFASGNINLKGPLNNMLMSINAMTTKPGNLHIPLNSSSDAGTTNLLTFRQRDTIVHIDPYEQLMEKMKKEKKQSNFDVKMTVRATNTIEAFVEIEKETGNVLSGRGDGVINMDIIQSKGIFNLKGDYTLQSGKYHFVALGLASRDFNIRSGSTVHFNGDIFDTTLDIDAFYRTKASIGPLIADETSVSNRRNIDCGIKITEKMMNPRLSFHIDVPDLDPVIKSKVDNALSTDDKMQKQFLSLIISNNFLPDEQSGIVNNSSVLYSNVSEIMANQINNIFEKLDIPVDLGINYQPNDKGTDIFDVALSTQLFNNRVIVNGSVGNKQSKLGSTSNDVVGDIDIEIKLDKSGGWRLNIFSHSADQYTNFLDDSQRNGIGITWQQEFNSISRYFKTLFMNKENRRKAKLEDEAAMLDGGKVKIKITRDSPEIKKRNRRHGRK